MAVSNQISVRELHRHIQQRRHRRVEGHALCLERCYRHIHKAVAANTTCCIFDVPEFIFGVAPYDLSACVAFIMRNLGGNGFDVEYYFPRTLMISWDLADPDAPPRGHVARLPEALGPAIVDPKHRLQPAGGGPGGGGQPGRLMPVVDRTMLPPPMSTSLHYASQQQQYPGHDPGRDPGDDVAAAPVLRRSRPPAPSAFRSITEFKPTGKFVMSV
jgi:hypothetical protein